ncbi:hypothetical protein [Ruthenibacterium lactatiformans]|nr:hypothetical protein [Ruthenibacterium lactatiformans]MBN3032133.1 hypothetical protein [Ruthenibacterium lactatiformans]
MSEEHRKINYDLAKAEADKVDEQIIAALQNGIRAIPHRKVATISPDMI